MAPMLKTLPILLATATIICGATVKKSEKRGIADFSSGFSSSRLEGTGIKISTDFGKELTLEEFKQNGYRFGDQKNVDLGLDINNYNFDAFKNLEPNFNIGQQFLDISQQNKDTANSALQQANQGIQDTQEDKQFQLQFTNENQGLNNFAQNNQENINKESSSLSYVTQNIPFPVHQPYPVFVNHPVAVPVPQQIPVNIPKPEVQQYQVQVNNPYQVPVNQHAPELHSARALQNQENPVSLTQSYPAQTNQPQHQNLFIPDANAQNQAPTQQNQLSDGQYFGNNLQNGKENDHDIQRKEISSKLYTSTGNQIFSHESESTANNGFVPSLGHNIDLQKLQSGHQFSQVQQHFQTPTQIGSQPRFQQNFQAVQFQNPQGQQPTEDHSIFTGQGQQTSAQSTLNGQENGLQQNFQTNVQHSALSNLPQGGQSAYQIPSQDQQALNDFIQNFQSKNLSPGGNFQQSYQTNADLSALSGLAQGAQYNFQGLGQGHQSLSGLQQSSHTNEGQAQGQVASSSYFPEEQKTGAFNQHQTVYSQTVGNSNNVNKKQARQDLENLREYFLKRKSVNVGQQYLTGSNKYGANV